MVKKVINIDPGEDDRAAITNTEARAALAHKRQVQPPAKIHMALMKIFPRTAVLSFGFAVAIGAAAEAQPLSTDRDMVTGVSVTEADCRALSGRLWVRAENRGFCVRFWLSTAGGSKDEALVAFHGDIGGMIDGKPQLLEPARPVSDESLQKAADTDRVSIGARTSGLRGRARMDRRATM